MKIRKNVHYYFGTFVHFNIDIYRRHIVPWHDGGKTEPKNLQMLCKHCNRTKSGK
ncbi:MAG: HNH endonuclease [Lachnospiraceae bacterium]|nr:HNH endonuclease [Lachnospiraceae bacterium]